MSNISHAKIEAARAGLDPSAICKLPSGWVFLCSMQFLRGYCILQADPVVESINSLDPDQRAKFLYDMVLVGDAIMAVTGAYRINYALLGNSDPVLHAHIVLVIYPNQKNCEKVSPGHIQMRMTTVPYFLSPTTKNW